MAKKKFGQNFLINDDLSKEIVNLVEIQNKNVLEIGPGNMALTEKIYNKKPKKFFTVEIDNDLIKKYENNPLLKFIINKDALDIDEVNLFDSKKFSIISNLPFNISTQLLLKWLNIQNTFNCIESMTLMFQKELAERITAKVNTKKYGRLSIISSAFFKIEKKIEVNKVNFFPVPKVDATVLKFTPLKINKIKKTKIKNLEKITKIFFNERRKINLKKIKKNFSGDQIKKWNLEKYFYMRPENLTKETYYLFSEIL